MTVLILGDENDPHVQAVREAAVGFGSEVFLFNFRSRDSRVTFVADRKVSALFVNTAGELHSSAITSVWWRIKPILPNTPPPNPIATNFKNREWEFVLRSLPKYMEKTVQWVNPIERQVFLNYKPNQLAIALEAGLLIPRTLFSNDSGSILDEFQAEEKIVYKTISPFVDPPDGVIMTNFVPRETIAQTAANIAVCPGTFQKPIEKSYELRVYVVGGEIFAFRVDSQRSQAGRLDWRRAQDEDIFQLTRLDEEVARRIMRFHSLAGIVYGAYDLIVSVDGQTYFLECNPGGQWLWLEHALGVSIANRLGALLARR